MKLRYIIPILAAVAAVSCQKEEAGIDFNTDPNAVRINAAVGGIFTRSNPLEEGTKSAAFKTGDVIAVAADAQAAVKYTFDGTNWSATAGEYLRWDAPTMTFKAWYPATATMESFTLPVDQNEEGKIASADYMTFSGNLSKTATNAIDIELTRKTARVIVEITAFGNQYTEEQKTVRNVKINSPASGYENSMVTGSVTAVAPFASGSGALKYTALVIPTGEGKLLDTFVTLTDGAGNDLSIKGIPAFNAGKSYTYSVTVGKNAVIVNSVTVTDWNNSSIDNADAEPFIDYVDISAGTFMMGSPGNEPGHNLETQHQVTLTKGFKMSKFEITAAQYAAFLNDVRVKPGLYNPIQVIFNVKDYGEKTIFLVNNDFTPTWNETTKKWESTSDHPMTYVTWYGAKAFADWVGGSLPTEAQWEYACRAGSTTAYSFGDDAAKLDGYCWYTNNSDGQLQSVGQKMPNPWGLYDMHGNAAEWCLDYWDDLTDYDPQDVIDPLAEFPGTGNDRRIVRGGSIWLLANAVQCRSASRSQSGIDTRKKDIGFRVIVMYP